MAKSRLAQVRGRKFVGVAELVDQASRMLGLVAPVQERGTVTEVPDERTVRYYLNEGLIAPADEKKGTSSVFGYRHLLQLLAVKKLQSEHLPIRKIRELIPGRDVGELERLIGLESGPNPNDREAARYLDTLLVGDSLPHSVYREATPVPSARATSVPPEPRESIRQLGPPQPKMNTQRSDERVPPLTSAASKPASVSDIPFAASAGTWERIEIQPGLEVHIRSDYNPPAEGRDMRALARLIMESIEAHKRNPNT